jgi:hypothetical protein
VARVAGVVLCLLLAPMLAPAANASFTGTRQASTSYSTATLLAPAEQQTDITIACNVLFLRATITVKNYGFVANANYYEWKIFSGSNPSPVFIGELGQEPAKSTYSTTYALSGTWRVEIRAQYVVPHSTNIWTSLPVTRTLSC